MRRAVRFCAGVGSGFPVAVVEGAEALPAPGVAGSGVFEPGSVATGVEVADAGCCVRIGAVITVAGEGVADGEAWTAAAGLASSSAGGWAAENPTQAAANPATETPARADFRKGCRSLPKPRQRAFTTLIPCLWRETGQR